jgi:ferredoxin-thioredoxin reductase catalytic subunit
MNGYVPGKAEIDELYERLDREAEGSGYHLNPDGEFTTTLVEGLLVNENRYGYQACPCRLADGDKKQDLDIICPCDYRDADLDEYNTCYCKLYVSAEAKAGAIKVHSIPERRPPEEDRTENGPAITVATGSSPAVWRCRVCGYLCARENPPGVCPICKATKERFERFLLIAPP